VIREYEAGLTTAARNHTVRHAVEDWLAYGLHGRAKATVDLVARNVVGLCGVPRGRAGRSSKSLAFDEAKALLHAAQSAVLLHAYITVSLLTGARTEELRALTWDHVDLDGRPDAGPPHPPSIDVWRSVREGGDTKTPKSRRTLALPGRCVHALRRLREHQTAQGTWSATGIVFASAAGTELDAAPRSPRRSTATSCAQFC
jgi:integrase